MRKPCAFLAALGLLAISCAGAPTPPAANPMRYRLSHSGTYWDVVGTDRVLDDLRPRYPAFFDVVLDPAYTEDADLRPLRRDLEHVPVDRRNYDALNAIAIAYFELNYRAEALRDRADMAFLGSSIRVAHLVAIPWRAYGEIHDSRLRDAILDFFEDVSEGEKLGSAATRGRLARVVASLEKKEADPARRARIREIAAHLAADAGPAAAGP
jgi:hypothetical protein